MAAERPVLWTLGKCIQELKASHPSIYRWAGEGKLDRWPVEGPNGFAVTEKSALALQAERRTQGEQQ